MSSKPEKPTPKGPSGPPIKPRPNSPAVWLILVAMLVALFLYFGGTDSNRSEISSGFFRQQLIEEHNIKQIRLQGLAVQGEFSDPPTDPSGKKDASGAPVKLKKKFTTELPRNGLTDDELGKAMWALGDEFNVIPETDGTGLVLVVYLLVTVALFAGVWFMFRRARDQFGGGLLSSFGKSPAIRYEMGDKPITFDDVAGLVGVKRELEEVVEFLKNPKKFQRLGGRVPKGILLMGPPGTGKTLLGRAVAGEAGAPFFSINGSEFIQMFVGVGASRVRDMFSTAKDNAPSILFIDEIDAVGRHRGAGLGGGHDEREQTLNQILSEMDGFSQTESVIVMAATNRPDVLDPALLRPGRFDRHITVDRPTHKGRVAIFEVHTREVPLSDDVDLERMAAGAVGLTGADIRNLVNEAALWASRHDKQFVEMSDFEHARDKVLMGAKRDEVLTGKEKTMTAYHESGHVLLAWMKSESDRVHKVSIIPRGRSLGATQLLPEEDRVNICDSELHTRLLFLLGGREAEKLVFDEFSAGAEDDLKKATQLARRMITHWGMSEKLGPVAFRSGDEQPFLGKEMSEPRQFSEHSAQLIDGEIARFLTDASKRATKLLIENRDKLDALATALEREETLDQKDIEKIVGPPAYQSNRQTNGDE